MRCTTKNSCWPLAIAIQLACTGHAVPPSSSANQPAGGPPNSPGADTVSSGLPPSECRPPFRRLWALSPSQLGNTLLQAADQSERDRVEDDFLRLMISGDPFSNVAQTQQVNTAFSAQLIQASQRLAAALESARAPLFSCTSDNRQCLVAALRPLVERLWRRKVTEAELNDLIQFGVDSKGPVASSALRKAVLSPEAIFRKELGAGVSSPGQPTELTPFERADLIALTLEDAPADEPLWKAAENDTLRLPGVVSEHVRRLLAKKPAAAEVLDVGGQNRGRRLRGVLRFFQEWLGADAVLSKNLQFGKDEERVRRWLSNEPILLVLNVLWSNEPTLKALLTSPNTFSSNTLALYYGLPPPPLNVSDDQPRPASPGRLGLLGEGGFLAGHPTTSSRGKWIRSRLLCEDTPLPAEVDMDLANMQTLADRAEKRPVNPREVRLRHLADPNCKSCHLRIDPLGYPFDSFDNRGLGRTLWNSFPIDTKGRLETDSESLEVTNATEMINALARSKSVRACFVRQLYAFAHGRSIAAEDTCFLNQLVSNFEASDGNIRGLIVDVLANESMQFRTVEVQ